LSVNPTQVQSILVASDEAALDTCAAEITRGGGQVLYRNGSGLLFADRKPGELGLHGCQAAVSANQPLQIPAASPAAGAQDLENVLRLLPAEEIGARSFINAHPQADGRGVVVAILDTGVELDHPMLKKTPNGQDKIIDFQDFSGEGRVALAPVTVGTDGSFVSQGTTYSAQGVNGYDYRFGIFPGAMLARAGELGPVDTFSDLGVLVYRDGGANGKWLARIDTNNDKSFSDETALYDFSQSRLFVKIGQKKLLSVSVNLDTEGKVASLCFDDGAHGTNVAGISTGNDPSGLRGVAPGAQVMMLKIGNNQLSGGATTTASMMLAIDYAASHGARVANMSYGSSPGSDVGTSTIDAYVDKVAVEKGLIFSISAGNEGPGMLTVGTPAGAEHAFTNAAYLSKETAQSNFGYLNYEEDRTWFFSSVGPLLDGSWHPTLLAPGTAVASVPIWSGATANYSGTSMASPEVTGGVALLLSAALQDGLPTDRISVTRAVYASAHRIPGLAWVEQGHGLLSVPDAYAELAARKADVPVEYRLAVNSPTAPGGKGRGIYVRSRVLPANVFRVTVGASYLPTATPADKIQLRTFRLEPSASWIRTPGTFWVNGSPNGFQAQIDPSILSQPGLHSEKITAIDDQTGKTAFEVPVTIVSPEVLGDANAHHVTHTSPIRVGESQRYFFDVPAGTTALQLALGSDGPPVWGQLVDPEGRTVSTLKDASGSAPQTTLYSSLNVNRAGVYELDVVAPGSNARIAQAHFSVRAYGLAITRGAPQSDTSTEVTVQNNFEPAKLGFQVQTLALQRQQTYTITGDTLEIPFAVTADDIKDFSRIDFEVLTSKAVYDQMTDYPYYLLDSKNVVTSPGALELDSHVTVDLSQAKPDTLRLHIQGSFAKEAPKTWSIRVKEVRYLKAPAGEQPSLSTQLETDQFQTIAMPLATDLKVSRPGFRGCPTLTISAADGSTIQYYTLCE
jgi:subtilisin family serine protease